MKAHIVQHSQVAVIGKADVFHPDFALHICKGFGIRLVFHRRLGTHNLHKAVQAGEAVGEQL